MFFHTCTFHKIQDGELLLKMHVHFKSFINRIYAEFKNINMREYDNWESNMGLQF